VEDVEAMKFRYGNGVSEAIAGKWNGKLNDAGETITLLNPGGDTLQSFAYTDKDPWPKAADGDGASVVLVNPDSAPDHKNGANWTASAQPGGTPGTAEGEPEETGLLEFALGTDLAGAPAGSLYDASVADDGGLVFTYRRRSDAPGITYAIEESTDLRNWTAVAVPGNPEETEHEDGTRTVRVYLPTIPGPGMVPRFFRLKVSR
jgi:hypothetical protein